MSIPYSHGTSFDTATTIHAWVEYPFREQGDSTTKVYHHTMRQTATAYAPLADDVVLTAAGAKPERSPFSDDSAAYFAGDYGLSHIGDGLIEFDRQFANIPQDRIESNGFYAFEFPVVPGGINISKNSTSENTSYDTGAFTVTITATLSAADAASFNDGDFVYITNPNYWEYDIGSATYSRSNFYGISSKSGNTITLVIENFYYLSGGTTPTAYTGFTDNTPTEYVIKIIVAGSRANPVQLNSPSIVNYRYLKVSSPLQIPLLEERFQLLTSSGVVTTATSATTTPLNTAEYQNAALAGQYIINAEPERITKWKNNIYELAVIRVKAK